jgi:hypothetical protein
MAKKELIVDKLNSVMQECIGWKSLVTVTEWSNQHGYDIHITSMNGGMQHLSITYEEFLLVEDAIKKIGNL